jgi:serine/threonine protein kinase
MISTRDASRSATPVAEGVLRPDRRVFNRYLLQRLVGRGGMGVVWLARDEKLDRPIALKFLPEVLFMDAAARDDLKRETRRSLDLTHPHIVRIHDFVEDEEMAAIAMEYVDGPTLSELRVQQPSRCFEPDGLGVWTAGLCAALEYAHQSARCVHRDLKPGNLMVNARGALKVADFGISCSLHNTAARVSAWASTGGTLGYMSPQQLLGDLASPSDDIYSVGATLYELLTGKPPFFSGDLSVQIREVVPESVTERRRKLGLPGPPVPRVWEETIAACLSKEPRQRPGSASEIARSLGLVCAPLAESAPDLGESLPPTICFAPTIVSRRSKWMLAADRLLKSSSPLMRFRWPIITACALGVALVSWFWNPPATVESVAAPLAQEEAVSPLPAPLPVVPVAAVAPVAVAAPASIPSSAELSGDQLALVAPIPVVPSAALGSAVDVEMVPRVQIETIPAGIPFKVFASAYESPLAEVLRTGETPATLGDLPPGAYRVIFTPPGMASRAASLQVPAEGTAHFQQDFPHGTLKIRSQPEGADVFCDGREIGQTPLDWPVLPGRHELSARLNGRDARERTVQVADAAEQTLTFDFRGSSSSAKSRSRRSKKTEDDSMLTKVGRSLKTIFGGDKK